MQDADLSGARDLLEC